MANYRAGVTPTGVGTTARPCIALLNTASVTALLHEVAMFNSTTTDCTFELVEFTGGTAGSDLTTFEERVNGPAPSCKCVNAYSADVTVGERTGIFFELGAAIGDGQIEVFDGMGIEAALGSTSGLGLLLVEGAPSTAPRCRIGWEE